MNNFKDLLSDFLKQHHDIFYSLVYDSCENTRREACLVYSKKLYEYFNTQDINNKNLNLPTAEVFFSIEKVKTKYKSIIKAAEKGDLEAVETFIKNGVKVDIKNSHGTTALMAASRGKHFKVMKLLLEADADVNAKNKDGITALILASYYGNTEVVKLLLESGADVNVKDKNGHTALMIASIIGHAKVAELLEQYGAE